MIITEINANDNIFNEDAKVTDLRRELLDKLKTARDLTGKEIKTLLGYFTCNE